MIKKILFPIIVVIAFANNSFCQLEKDTALLLKEFNKVMSFAVQPHIYYTTITKMESVPVIESKDTSQMIGVFYKNGTNLYYSNGDEEMSLEDSLLIQINRVHKTIWINKVDVASRDKMNIEPLGNKKLQELFRKSYTINKSVTGNGSARMEFETKQNMEGNAGITTKIGLEYNPESYAPGKMDIEVRMQEKASDDILAALKMEGIESAGLIETINNEKYITRKQKVSILFSSIDNSEAKASGMPSLKDKLEYLPATKEFRGKGEYKEYEVIKTF